MIAPTGARALLAAVPGAAALCDAGGVLVATNAAFGRLDPFGSGALGEIVHPDDRSRLAPVLRVGGAVECRLADGGAVELRVGGEAEAGVRLVLALPDPVRREREDRLAAAAVRFRTAFDHAPSAIALVGLDGAIGEVNLAFGVLLGLPAASLTARRLADLAATPEQAELLAGALRGFRTGDGGRGLEVQLRHASGKPLDVLLHASVAHAVDGRPHHVILEVEPARRDGAASSSAHLADEDALTGLPARATLLERVGHALEDAGSTLIVLDIDDFRHVNELHGRAAGDRYLCALAAALRTTARPGETVARLGDDVFAVATRMADVRRAAARAAAIGGIVRALGIDAEGSTLATTATIGVAIARPGGIDDAHALLARAEDALHDARDVGPDRIVLWDAQSARREARHLRIGWNGRLRRALHEDGLTLDCQPVVAIADGRIDHHELLLRYIGADGRAVPPGEFLPSAERSGLIVELDCWVIRAAIDLVARHSTATDPVRLGVNLSAQTIEHVDVADLVASLARRRGVDPSLLVFEITETSAIANLERASTLARRLQGLGCRIALDDFGAGFGSFSYLKRIPVDILKIDGDFVRGVLESPEDRAIVAALVDVARATGRLTVAEFVEGPDVLEELRVLGVDFAQGYHLSRPAPASALLAARAAR